VLKKIFSTFSIRFASAIINLLIAVVISRFLGASGKGEQGIMLTTIAFIILFDNLVGGASVVYLTPRLKLKNILVASYLWSLFISIVSYVILLITDLVPTEYQLAVAALSGMCSIVSINSSILIGKEKIDQSNIINFMMPLLTLLTVYFLFKTSICITVNAYLIALFITYFICFLLSFRFLLPYFTKEDKSSSKGVIQTLKIMLGYGLQNQLAHVFQLLSFRISFYVLEYYWSKSQVGIYSNGVSIIESVWMISSSITLFQYARIVNTSDKSYAINLTEILTKYGMLVAALALIPILVLPSVVYTSIFGPDFKDLNILILFLAPGIWVFNYALIIGHYFSGIGKYYINAIASGVGLVVTIPAVFLFVPKYHIYGAAISATISYFCTSMVVLYFFKRSGGKLVLFPNLKELKDFYHNTKNAVTSKIRQHE
jgi:O-antigen/teichoic acid export membrane protein